MVAHSHDDVGWLLTPEEYYDGCDPTNGPNRGVRGIINSVVDALLANSSRRFIQVEMYFFDQWMIEQTPERITAVRGLIASGQLEFINAGWSMHDEACVHYLSGINNMALGAQRIADAFNATTTIGWHIDPFGHASATPRLMAQMGFNGFFFERQDYQQRAYQARTKTLEQVWRPSASLGASVEMFTSPMQSYGAGCDSENACPSQFCCMDCEQDINHYESIVNHTQSLYKKLGLSHLASKPYHTLDELASSYMEHCIAYAQPYRTNHIMMPWGSDFQFQNAVENFEFMDALMNKINSQYEKYGVRLHYSTPSRYITALHNLQYRWPVNENDYFLDSDNAHAYWSGYLSSRSAYKGYERQLSVSYLSAFYQLQMSSVKINPKKSYRDIRVMREALGVAQHHDSITGTEREAVRDRYQLLLANGTAAAMRAVSEIVQNLTGDANISFCPLSNISVCDPLAALESFSAVPLYVYNQLGTKRLSTVVVPIPHPNITVIDSEGGIIQSQVSTAWEMSLTPDNTSPTGRQLPYLLHFLALTPPLSLEKFIIKTTNQSQLIEAVPLQSGVSTILENDVYRVTIDAVNGGVTSILNKVSNQSSGMNQNFYHYCPNTGDDISQQNSGAYIFRPCVGNEKPLPFSNSFNTTIIRGPLFDEVRQVINSASNIHQAISVFKGPVPFVMFLFGLGEIDISGPQGGKEVVMRFDSEITSGTQWYTDSQGLEVEQRVRDARPNYPYTPTEPVAANFFPSYAFAYLQDASNNNRSLGVIGDRSRAVASLESGSLEFLVHRRLLTDDGRGVDQALNENTRIMSRNFVIMNDPTPNVTLRTLALVSGASPIVMIGAPSNDISNLLYGREMTKIGITDLPRNVHLLSKEYRSTDPTGVITVLIRLQHLFAIDDDPVLSQPATVDVATLFPDRKNVAITEMDLNGVRYWSGVTRYQWMTDTVAQNKGQPVPLEGTVVTLNPMEVRTFECQVN
jgi:hypothetical protein